MRHDSNGSSSSHLEAGGQSEDSTQPGGLQQRSLWQETQQSGLCFWCLPPGHSMAFANLWQRWGQWNSVDVQLTQISHPVYRPSRDAHLIHFVWWKLSRGILLQSSEILVSSSKCHRVNHPMSRVPERISSSSGCSHREKALGGNCAKVVLMLHSITSECRHSARRWDTVGAGQIRSLWQWHFPWGRKTIDSCVDMSAR